MSRMMLLLGCTCVLCTFVGSAADAHHRCFAGVPAFGRCTLASMGTPVAARCGQRRYRTSCTTPTVTQRLRMQLYKSDYLSDPLPDPDRSQSGWPGTGNIGPFDVDLPAIPVMTGPASLPLLYFEARFAFVHLWKYALAHAKSRGNAPTHACTHAQTPSLSHGNTHTQIHKHAHTHTRTH